MKISVYMEAMAYKYGGAGAYTAGLIEALQKMYPGVRIRLITEQPAGKRKVPATEFVAMQNRAYGTDMSGRDFSIAYFGFRKIDESLAKNGIIRKLRIIHKEFLSIKQAADIRRLSEGSDLFINASLKIISGKGKKNICIVHFPFPHTAASGINSRLPFFRAKASARDYRYGNGYDLYLPNSSFTAGHLKERWHIPESKIKVLYPPVRMAECRGRKNQNQIFACGRFNREKKTGMLIEAFSSSEFLSQNATLVVAGTAQGEDPRFIEGLQKSATGRVKLVFDPDREELEALYASSGIFWHAMGYGEEEPVRFEHFGITTVEAMSAGCVPVVINKGGQKEIVTEDCGYRWDTPEELVERTEFLIRNPGEAERLRANSMARSRIFSKEVFCRKLSAILADAFSA